jgi:peptidoglycan/xylan/chitin deacetylase (PgdA/CDA1 family)
MESARYWSGAARIARRISGASGAVILMYHSVAGPAEAPWIVPRNRLSPQRFEAQLRYLKQHRVVVGLDELVDALERGDAISPGTVVITFDDGYRDNLDVAAPILERYGFPAVLYLATGYVERAETQWADRLYVAIARRSRHELRVNDGDADLIDLSDAPSRRWGFRRLADRLITATVAEREQILADVEDQLRPVAESPRLTLTWDEVRDLRERYPRFQIGVHTRNHLDLSTHGGPGAETEIRDSVDDVRREVGEVPVHFSFPYNRPSEPARQVLRDLGLRSAVAAGRHVLVKENTDRFALPRVEAPRSMTMFRLWSGGVCSRRSLDLMGNI